MTTTYNTRLEMEIMRRIEKNKGLTNGEKDEELRKAYRRLVQFLASAAMGNIDISPTPK